MADPQQTPIDWNAAQTALNASVQTPVQLPSGAMQVLNNAVAPVNSNQSAPAQDPMLLAIQGQAQQDRGERMAASQQYRQQAAPLLAEQQTINQQYDPALQQAQLQEKQIYAKIQQSQAELSKIGQEAKPSISNWIGAFGTLAAMVGYKGGNKKIAAMDSLTGALEGIKDADITRYKKQMEQWKANNDSLIQQATDIHQQYMDILNDRKSSQEEIHQKIQDLAGFYGHDPLFQAAASRDIGTELAILKQAQGNITNAQKTSDQLDKTNQNYSKALDDMVDSQAKLLAQGYGTPEKALTNYRKDPEARSMLITAIENRARDQYGWTPGMHDKVVAEARAVGRSEVPTKMGDTTQAIVKVDEHMKVLRSRYNALGNGNIKLFNQMKNETADQLGDATIAAYKADAVAVASEFNKVFVPNGGAESDRQERMDQLDAAKSPAQFMAVAEDMQKLMQGQAQGFKVVMDGLQQGKKIQDIATDQYNISVADDSQGNGNPVSGPPPLEKRTIGMVVDSPQGKVSWNGTGWDKVGSR